jgi:ABC-2 type transport system ATP-binding protein
MIAVDNLWKTYPGTTALRGVSLGVDKGRVVGVLGENGSGKSTLFKVIAGVARASEGRVEINGLEIGTETRRMVSYLPEVSPFYDWMTIGEQLEFVAAFYPDWQPEKERELLELMRLEANRKIGVLSDGQKARLKVVVAFARPSAVVLMDEPFGRIDPPSRRRILEALLREYRMGEQTILISTHLVDEIEELIEEVVFLREGEIALKGNSDELRSQRNQSLCDIFEEVVS